MDKQEKKRDVAVFSNMLKELMNSPMDDVLVTLDRDIQHFIYGRVAVLVKHNEGKPIGSIADISAVVGSAYANVLSEFIRNRSLTSDELSKLVLTAKDNLVTAFEMRAPTLSSEESQSSETEEVVEQEVEG